MPTRAAQWRWRALNILTTTRYGAESNREGFVRNHVLGVYFSSAELFSNLELTQQYYDAIAGKGALPDYLSVSDFTQHWPSVAQQALGSAATRHTEVSNLEAMLKSVRELYGDEVALKAMLTDLDAEAQRYVRENKGGGNSGEATPEAGS